MVLTVWEDVCGLHANTAQFYGLVSLILVSEGVLKPIPHGYRGTTTQDSMHLFFLESFKHYSHLILFSLVDVS